MTKPPRRNTLAEAAEEADARPITVQHSPGAAGPQRSSRAAARSAPIDVEPLSNRTDLGDAAAAATAVATPGTCARVSTVRTAASTLAPRARRPGRALAAAKLPPCVVCRGEVADTRDARAHAVVARQEIPDKEDAGGGMGEKEGKTKAADAGGAEEGGGQVRTLVGPKKEGGHVRPLVGPHLEAAFSRVTCQTTV